MRTQLTHPEPFPDRALWRGWMERIIDGDTVVTSLDLGFSIQSGQTIRIAGLNTPEIVGAERAAGLAARAFVELIAPPGTPLRVWTEKMRKSFDRYIADIEFLQDGEWKDLAETIIAAGHGRNA